MNVLKMLAANLANNAGLYVGSQRYAYLASAASRTFTFTTLVGGSRSAPVENDIVFISMYNTGANAAFSTVSAGWTEITELFHNSASGSGNFAVYYKVMGATPDTSMTVDFSPNAATWGYAYVLANSSGLDNTTTSWSGISTTVNPPANTVATAGSTALVIATIQSTTAQDFTAFTTTELLNFVSYATAGHGQALGIIPELPAGGIDPIVLGGGASSSNASGAAVTIIVKHI